eukprot:6996451-Pyramimonas_sp.AAC.2
MSRSSASPPPPSPPPRAAPGREGFTRGGHKRGSREGREEVWRVIFARSGRKVSANFFFFAVFLFVGSFLSFRFRFNFFCSLFFVESCARRAGYRPNKLLLATRTSPAAASTLVTGSRSTPCTVGHPPGGAF